MERSGGLEGVATLITGGGSGIGLACAQRFARDGAHVTICGRSQARLDAAAAVIRGVAASGVTVLAAACDVTVEADVAAAMETAAAVTGSLDAVVACAGGNSSLGPLTMLDVEAWRATLDLNLTGTMLTVKHAGRVMARQGSGSIVGVSSIAASNTHRWFGAYGPAKSGIDYLCRLAADELGAGVRVNCIRPGLVDTDLAAALTAPGPVLDDYLACTPLGRYGHVDDIAAMARFLVGSESSWVTGTVINVDGGHHLRRGPDISPLFKPRLSEDNLRGVV